MFNLSKFREFCQPNIGIAGRIARGLVGVGCLSGAWYLRGNFWGCVLLTGSGAFTLFEALRGWCVARACGLKTPM
jgi:hypothetical protein